MKLTTPKYPSILMSVMLLSLVLVAQAAAQMGELQRCVLQDGSEVYVARDVAKKDLTGFDCKMRQSLGFVYLEQTDSTVPVYSLRRIMNGKATYRVVTSGDIFQSLQSPNRGGWMPYPGDGIIGYVSFTKVPGTLGAYGFTQKNVKGDQERYRIEGKELDTWGAMTSVVFNSTPSFFIWKEKTYGAGVETFKNLQDITFRPTIYANGTNNNTINFKAKYGTPEKLLTLSCTDAVATSQKYCQFNIGILLTRTDTATQQTFHVTATGGETPVGNTGVFEKGESTAEIILPIRITKAKSTVTIRLDDLPADQDKNRDNNTLKVKTFVTTN